MRRGLRLALVITFLCALFSIPAYAGSYEVFIPDSEDDLPVFEDIEIDVPFEEASASDATPSDAGIMLLSNYNPYDGSMSTSVVQYFRAVLEKLPPDVDYVRFRESQYEYRMVYSDAMEFSVGVFSADTARYILYDARSSSFSWTAGDEGVFRLSTADALVYSSLGDVFPSLDSGVRRYDFQALLFGICVFAIAAMCFAWFNTRNHYTL